ncbi:hypothetical protein [Nocardia bhagyanarayanae]|uniref:hypothetical protein n=1 Tax=Nocardia bhagyanarayanae TaxID=1215925 RepID=UPI00114D752C|nr:hypothetical protein [Nocardia bhagyanarayanae]
MNDSLKPCTKRSRTEEDEKMHRFCVSEMPSRDELQNPSEAVKKFIPASDGGRDDTSSLFTLAVMQAAVEAEENGSGDDVKCFDIFSSQLPTCVSKWGLKLNVHSCGVYHIAGQPLSVDHGDTSSIYWVMQKFSDRPRTYDAIALPSDAPKPADSLIDQYNNWSQSAGWTADQATSDSTRFSAFVEKMSGSLNTSGDALGGTAFVYYNTNGGMVSSVQEECEMLWSIAPFGSEAGHNYECVTALPK